MSNPHGSEPFARLTWNRTHTEKIRPANLQGWGTTNLGSDIERLQGDLYLGESASVMTALMTDHAESIDLIYIDQPFLTGNAYRARVGHDEDSRRPDEWETIQSYQDTWEDGAEYLDTLYARLVLMYRLLSPTGSLYLHLDWHASAYARVILDEIFGPNRLLNEIVWVYHGPSPIKSAFNRKHDTILAYTKSDDYTFNADDVRVPYKDSTVRTFASSSKAGFGKKPNLKRGKVPEDWWYFPVVARLHNERTGYPTQKPEALMERIILASTNPGDLVADFFVGSGTTVSVAARNNRRWIACDPSPLAFMTTYRRLLYDANPAQIQLWQDREFGHQHELQLDAVTKDGEHGLQVELKDVVAANDPPLSFPDDITLWELDPQFDGSLFNSQYQATRGWRDADLSTSLTIPASIRKSVNVALRAFDHHGRTGFLVL